jgi:hypothetical protein
MSVVDWIKRLFIGSESAAVRRARELEGDCTVGAGAGFGKYTREIAATKALSNLFKIGEIINPDSYSVQLKITKLNPLTAIVIKSVSVYGNPIEWFPVGLELTFELGVPWLAAWIINNPPGLPWFILSGERKSFEHYI